MDRLQKFAARQMPTPDMLKYIGDAVAQIAQEHPDWEFSPPDMTMRWRKGDCEITGPNEQGHYQLDFDYDNYEHIYTNSATFSSFAAAAAAGDAFNDGGDIRDLKYTEEDDINIHPEDKESNRDIVQKFLAENPDATRRQIDTLRYEEFLRQHPEVKDYRK
jgi:hypothetical protein